MRSKLLPLSALVVLLAGCGGGGGADRQSVCLTPDQPLATSAVPSDYMTLSHWSLTVPVDASGNRAGIADTISTSELTSGYTSDWFYATENNGVTFFAPVQGATTAHTVYPRSELRELLDPADSAVNWTSADVADLSASLVITQVPGANGKVTIGEIVGYNRDNPDINVLTKLVYEYNRESCLGTLYLTTLPSPGASGSTASRDILSRSVRLGETFQYSIHVENHEIRVSDGSAEVVKAIDPSWDTVGLYFRAGASLFANGADPLDGARVTFFSLEATHP